MKYIMAGDFAGLIGILPEILFFFEFLFEWLVDWIFWLCLDKRRQMILHDISSAKIKI